MKTSKFLQLNTQDFVKGLIVAILTPFVYALMGYLETGAFPTIEQIKPMAIIALSSGLGYLLKNWVSNSENKPFKAETKS